MTCNMYQRVHVWCYVAFVHFAAYMEGQIHPGLQQSYRHVGQAMAALWSLCIISLPLMKEKRIAFSIISLPWMKEIKEKTKRRQKEEKEVGDE